MDNKEQAEVMFKKVNSAYNKLFYKNNLFDLLMMDLNMKIYLMIIQNFSNLLNNFKI